MTPLEETLTNNVDRRLAAAQPSPDLNIYDDPDSGPELTTPDFPFNGSCWAADFDFTCASPYNNYYYDKMAGTLVTPRHFILASHYAIDVGKYVWFFDRDGNGTSIEVVARAAVGSTDIAVLQLAEDVPEGIQFASVLPSNWADYITSNGAGLPTVYLNAARSAADETYYQATMRNGFHNTGTDLTNPHNSRQARVADVSYLDSGGIATVVRSADSTRAATFKFLYFGDSGSPVFLFPRATQPILLFCVYQAGQTSMWSYALHHYTAAINSVISGFANNGGYQLTAADLSSFAEVLNWSALKHDDWEILTVNQWSALEA